MTHQPCPNCRAEGRDRSGDNLVDMPNGAYCFACGYYENSNTTGTTERDTISDRTYSYQDLPDRKIRKDTCKRFGYVVDDQGCHVAQYMKDGKAVARHIRTPDKKFKWAGYSPDIPLFGQHLWESGKHLRITEGEIDCLSVWQAMGGDWPVVSVPNGADSAVKHVKANLDFIGQFETVTFVFDMDEPGQTAAKACAELLPPGKAKITHLTHKDPNEYLKAGKSADLVKHIFSAKDFRPDGIISGGEVTEDEDSLPVYKHLNYFTDKMLLGRQAGEIVGYVSGTGMGKSTYVRQQQVTDLEDGYKCGIIMLEETCLFTKRELIGLHIGKPVNKILRARALEKMYPNHPPLLDATLDPEEYREGEKWFDSLPIHLYNHKGVVDPDMVYSRLEYMAKGLDCTHLYLDHISITVSGQQGNDERKDLDRLSTHLRSLTENTGVVLHVVSQLGTPDGKPFEEGAQISTRDIRGSRFIAQTMNSIIAFERNQQVDDPTEKNTTTVRALKARGAGTTGVAGRLFYNHNTGRLEDLTSSATQTTRQLLDVGS